VDLQKLKTESPLLSIVIATKNRVPYAISAIDSILAIDSMALELVIQDNSDTLDLKDHVERRAFDPRLKYRYTPPPLSSIGNFNLALELATGEYVCLIGDDDGVNPEVLEAAAWAKSQSIDSLGGNCKVHYLWSGTGAPSTLFTKVSGEVLTISEFSGKIVMVDVEQQLQRLVRNGGVYYLDFHLPKLYHGLVRRACLEEIRARTGEFLGGLSPDIFASLSVACIAKRVAVTDYPLTIPGACAASTSVTEGAIRTHSKRLEDAPHFRSRDNYRWSEIVPRVYSVETIWADSGIAALTAMGRTDLVDKLNLPRLAAFCIYQNKGVAGMVLQGLMKWARARGQSVAITSVALLWNFLAGPGCSFVKRGWNRLMLVCGRRAIDRISGVRNMVETTRTLTQYLNERGASFKKAREAFSD
jgi:glycosyltransferase involved in cell wall biosynthesis